MITSMHIKNFKCFKKASLDLRPITVLLGKNNTGKSAILQALLMLKQTVESRDQQTPLQLNGNGISHWVYCC